MGSRSAFHCRDFNQSVAPLCLDRSRHVTYATFFPAPISFVLCAIFAVYEMAVIDIDLAQRLTGHYQQSGFRIIDLY